MTDWLLEVNGLKTHFMTPEGRVRAVDGVDMRIGKGRTLGVLGESGSGKSVTALSVMRLVQPPGQIVEGEIKLDGADILAMSEEAMRDVRGKDISMIFQEPMTSLNPVYTLGDQIAEFPLQTRQLVQPPLLDFEQHQLFVHQTLQVFAPRAHSCLLGTQEFGEFPFVTRQLSRGDFLAGHRRHDVAGPGRRFLAIASASTQHHQCSYREYSAKCHNS